MAERTCVIDGCEKRVFVQRNGWCSAHYSKWQKYGDPLAKRRGFPTPPCRIVDCATPGNGGHGWCAKHYRRWYRHGDPLATSRIVGDDLARFWSYVDVDGPVVREELGRCWSWSGATSPDGYGILCIAKQTTYMPRFSYELEHGPIAAGLEPDHLCRNRNCVNPGHLEPVTHRENILRGESPQAINARKTHCPKGHEYTPENIRWQRNGGRLCRACQKQHDLNRRGSSPVSV